MEKNLKENKIIAKKKGIVVSEKNNKTIIVSVDVLKSHSKYKKKYTSTKRYKVHDEENKHKIGEVVEIIPTRPISRDKRYRIA